MLLPVLTLTMSPQIQHHDAVLEGRPNGTTFLHSACGEFGMHDDTNSQRGEPKASLTFVPVRPPVLWWQCLCHVIICNDQWFVQLSGLLVTFSLVDNVCSNTLKLREGLPRHVFLHYYPHTHTPSLQEYLIMDEAYTRMNEERFENETDYLNMVADQNFESLTRAEEPDASSYINVQVGLYIDFFALLKL